MNDFKYLISPLYLLPAVIGTLFYNFTRNRMIVNREVFYQFRTKDNTIHFQMEMTPFWGKDKHPYLLFFIPGFNIILLIGSIVEYLRSRKATRLFLLHIPVKISTVPEINYHLPLHPIPSFINIKVVTLSQ